MEVLLAQLGAQAEIAEGELVKNPKEDSSQKRLFNLVAAEAKSKFEKLAMRSSIKEEMMEQYAAS